MSDTSTPRTDAERKLDDRDAETWRAFSEKLEAELTAALRDAEAYKEQLAKCEAHAGAMAKEYDAQVESFRALHSAQEQQVSAALRERDEAIEFLIRYTDSPEGHNFSASQQRDTANRLADELEKENAELRAERDASAAKVAELSTKVAQEHKLYTMASDNYANTLDRLVAEQAKRKEVESERDALRKTLFHVLHQRTGPMGMKVEDDLLRENEPLLLKCIELIRNRSQP